jgi:GMP synthase PP-ATPase subunit
LATRIVGEVSSAKVQTVRTATKIVEEELSNVGAFQFLAFLHEDNVTRVRAGKRAYG